MTSPETGVRTRLERPGEHAAVLDVVRTAFGADDREHGGVVADLVEAMHAEARTLGASSIVGVDGDEVVGHVGLTRGWVDCRDRLVEIQVLSPLSVQPERQGRGMGAALLRAAAERATGLGAPLILLEGDPGYYGQHGYVAADRFGLERPSGRIPLPACQVLLLAGRDASITGRLVYPDVFWRFDSVGLRGGAVGEDRGTAERRGRGCVMDTETRNYDTGDQEAVLDITRDVADFVRGFGDGVLQVFVPHATAGIAVIETGAGSDHDLLSALGDLLPVDDRWQHAHGSRGHGRAHVMPAIVPPHATFPVQNGELALGTWQSICLVDLNVDNRTRTVRLSFLAG